MGVVNGAMVRNDFIDEMERKLSYAASIPVVGTLAGLSKALVGVAMVVSGLAAVVFIGLPAAMFCNQNPLKQSVEFVKRGFKNIGRGLEEAIPGHGATLWQQRLKDEKYKQYLEAIMKLQAKREEILNAYKEAVNKEDEKERSELESKLSSLDARLARLKFDACEDGICLRNFKLT